MLHIICAVDTTSQNKHKTQTIPSLSLAATRDYWFKLSFMFISLTLTLNSSSPYPLFKKLHL